MCLNDFISESIERLCDRHNWLIRLTQPLFNLYAECRNIEEATLITELLENFLMIEDEERYWGYKGMADYIKEVYEPNTTLIVAMTKGPEPDSGQKVISELRTVLMEAGIYEFEALNLFDKLSPKKHSSCTKIIVVDEFIGSGKTVEGRFEDIQKKLPNVKEIHCCLLAGMKTTVSAINSSLPKGDNIYCHYQLEKGILGHYSGDALVDKTKTMLKIERRLTEINEKSGKLLEDYSMGYGNAQSLIAFGRWNIPNSVFPIFWWPYHINKVERKVLFRRYEKWND